MDLFDAKTHPKENGSDRPLAYRMRPETLDTLVGQDHLTARGSLLYKAIEDDRVFSILLWGPPGCGKTTLAGIIANQTKSEFNEISAVLSGVRDIRKIIDQALERRSLYRKRTILFVDEIHRFNKAQQDAFLHHVESGLITLIGATTQNPSFEVIPALVSRCRVFTLNSLNQKSIKVILKRALTDKKSGLGLNTGWMEEASLEYLAQMADGDARVALTNLETVAYHFRRKSKITKKDVETAIDKKTLLYDKAGEEHYNLISAFIKSMRGSNPDASVYWLERMLASGDDPYYLLRRMIRFATEDIGMADPGALTMALNASESFRILGYPEGEEVLFQAAIYLSTAPKSNAVYQCRKLVRKTVKNTGYMPAPLHIRNTPTSLMKDMDYGKGYKYAHDYKYAYDMQSYLPDSLENCRFYSPSQRGYEKTIKERMAAWDRLKEKTTPKK